MRVLLACLLFHGALSAENSDEHAVVICGVCRNVAPAIDNSIRNIEELGGRFRDYAVVIYENNSDDYTSSKLSQWAEKNSRVVFLTETLSRKKMARPRTVRIAEARNNVLQEVRKKKYKQFTYLIMVDLDFQSPWPIQEVVNSINHSFDWDCISANGMSPRGFYYDRYAFRSKEFPFGPELLDYEFWRELPPDSQGTWFTLDQAGWPLVFSAFGGLAIYKTDIITQFSYSGTVTRDLKKYYKKIVSNLPDYHQHLEKYQNLTTNSAKSQIKFRKNCMEWQQPDDDSITTCEHVTLHASMALKGYGVFYINPKLIMQY